jgi:putative effector of murein hydrolase
VDFLEGGSADEVTDPEGGLAMHGSSMALGTVGSIIREMATGQVKALGMMLVEIVHFGWGSR